MYHYNLNNVNFTAVPIIHFIDSHLIHNNGSSPHLHHTTIFYPPRHSRLHQSTLQKCTINSRLPQPNFLNNFCFLDLSTLHGQWTCCWVRKNPITLKMFTWYAVVFTHLSPWPLLVWYKCILGIFLQKKNWCLKKGSFYVNTTGGSKRPTELLQIAWEYLWHLKWGNVVVEMVVDQMIDKRDGISESRSGGC